MSITQLGHDIAWCFHLHHRQGQRVIGRCHLLEYGGGISHAINDNVNIHILSLSLKSVLIPSTSCSTARCMTIRSSRYPVFGMILS